MFLKQVWTNFNWNDFVLVKALGRTFIKRHLPLSNQSAWRKSKLVEDPEEWSFGDKNPVKSKKKRKKPESPVVITIWDSSEEGEGEEGGSSGEAGGVSGESGGESGIRKEKGS